MFKIHFLKTFWSDAILLEENNKFCLIDTAEEAQYNIIKESLDRFGVKEIDTMIITHFHKDHYGGAFNILDDYKVLKTYLQPYSNKENTTGDGSIASDEYRMHELEKYNELIEKIKNKSKLIMTNEINEIIFNNYSFKLFYNEDLINKVYENKKSKNYHKFICNENYNCMPMLMIVDKIKILFGSDMTDSQNEDECINMLNTKLHQLINGKIDIYKVSHHGVNWSHSKEGLAIIKPKFAIITNSMDTISLRSHIIDDLKEANPDVKVFTTAEKEITFTIENKEIHY